MERYVLNVELDVELGSGRDFGEVAFAWLDEVWGSALGDARAALEGRAEMPAAPWYSDPADWNPSGGPRQLWGFVNLGRVDQRGRRRSGRKVFGAGSMAWLRGQLDAGGVDQVWSEFGLTAGSEPVAPQVWWPTVYVRLVEDSPGWVRVGAHVPEWAFVDGRRGG